MRLSEVPFSELRHSEGWLTGHNGAKGTITEIKTLKVGRSFETHLYIEWDNGRKSCPKFPDECVHVTAEDPEPTVLASFVKHKHYEMRMHMEYWEKARKKV